MCVCAFSYIQFFATAETVAHQAPLSMEFSRQEYWSVLPFPSPGDLPDPGMEPTSLASPANCNTWEAPCRIMSSHLILLKSFF